MAKHIFSTESEAYMNHNNSMTHHRKLLLDSIPVAMVTMDAHFKITFFNHVAEHLTGFPATEAIGKHCYEILHSSMCDTECPLRTVQKCGKTTTGLKAEFVNRFQEHIPVRIGTTVVKNSDGSFLEYLEVIEDISREKALEREKNNFQFMVAHDMKSPLVAMQGLIRRIREHHDEMSAEKREEYFRIISEAGEQIEGQVMDFLEYSRQASRSIKIIPENINLTQLLKKLVQRHEVQAAEKALSIHLEYTPIQPIQADRRQLQRVFENLLDNSIKFADKPGEILITIAEANREVIVQVIDSGPGIAAGEIPFIFDAFHQHKSSQTGHGLGLAAVRAIVQEHGGRVAVASSLGEGATFTVRLPGKKANMPQR